ncbi:hypothetical protein GEV33_007012 [Tenebrio molitor]|uniref:Uncharacterized protein n=1 Tax=Tenebrio molitor TaxID=7067 RepID=A0A8J6HJH2_TENMO|nr:hypothetical protein GEV33_007012 [Tenebrio molitor]
MTVTTPALAARVAPAAEYGGKRGGQLPRRVVPVGISGGTDGVARYRLPLRIIRELT